MNSQSMRRLGLGVVFAVALAACGSTTDATTTQAPAAASTAPAATAAPTTVTTMSPTTVAPTTQPATTGEATELAVEAVDNEGFSLSKLTAPAGQISLTFNNKDAGGEPHNWRVKISEDESYATETKVGPDIQTITFTIGTPGDYTFICDVHPGVMTGVLTVTP